MDRDVVLATPEWAELLIFVREKLSEIAEFDDEDEQYVAVKGAVDKIGEQLGEVPGLESIIGWNRLA